MTIIKICGVTNLEDALHAISAGADLLGFILYPKSPRYVSPAQVAAIVATIRQVQTSQRAQADEGTSGIDAGHDQQATRPVRFAGVCVNMCLDHVWEMLEQAGLDYAQLHGDEPPEMLAQLAGRGYKAIRPKELDDALRMVERFAPLGVAEGPALLVDAYHPTLYGGSGQRGDWRIAAEIARRVPRLLLSGGLTADNVASAMESVRPWGVDVSSGVEAAPGKKDHQQVARFIENGRAAGQPAQSG
jgi:phosphoribosylanthranilate isomerase